MSDAWLGLGTGLAGAVLAYLGTRYTARASKEAQVTTAEKYSVADGYDRLNEDLWRSVTNLRERTEALEVKVATMERRYRIAVNYIRTLLIYIENNVPHGTPPDIPEDIGKDL